MGLRAAAWFILGMLLVSCSATAVPPTATPTLSPQATIGRQVFVRECGACHSLLADTIIVGPSLASIGADAQKRVPGQDAYTYLLMSVMQPDAYMVDGFEDLMPENLGKRLTGEEIDAVIAYLLTLE